MRIMKLVAEYVEQALKFDRTAAEATDPKLKESLPNQALAYRKLADTRGTTQPPACQLSCRTPARERGAALVILSFAIRQPDLTIASGSSRGAGG
jgi:hypothetical protein